MGLKDLKSNLAAGDLATESAENLTYGKGRAYDRPDQGFSDEPFIKGGINLGGDTGFNALTGGFIRGGILKHAERNLEDVARIGKFLITGRGITFLAKQIGLQKTNPKISKPAFPRSNANHRTYNFGVNTLAQVVGQGTGLHVNRQGLTPFAKDGYKDEDKFLADYKQGKNTNKLLYLFDNHIASEEAFSSPPSVSKIDKFVNKTITKFNNSKSGKLLIGDKSSELYSYNGGPGSTYGIGKTDIYKYSPFIPQTIDYEKTLKLTTGPIYSRGNVDPFLPSADKSYFTLGNTYYLSDEDNDYSNLDKRHLNFHTIKYQNPLGGKDPRQGRSIREYSKIWDEEGHILNGTSRVKNYLHTLGRIPVDNYFSEKYQRSDFKSYHREERVNLGNPGGNPTEDGNTTVDLLNAMDVFRSGGDLNYNAIRDLIRFRIEAVHPTNPTKSNVMVFRAFLDSLKDNFTANYNEFTYNGRGENFYTYNGFNRDISFSFKIAAQSSGEMKPLYRKLNYLVSNTAPEYHLTSNRMMTPFMRLTMGAYFDRLPGVIKNVGITWQKDYPWEITIDAPEGGSTSGLFVLPHVLDINVTYQPVHDFLPQKSIHSPFIVPHKDSPISNKPGRKLWNSDPISADAITAEKERIAKAKAEKERKEQLEKYREFTLKLKDQYTEKIEFFGEKVAKTKAIFND